MRESASVAMQKRLDGHQVSRCGRSGSGLLARLGRAQGDRGRRQRIFTASWGFQPFAGAKAAGLCPPPVPLCDETATCPTSCGLSPAHCTHSIAHAAGFVVTSCVRRLYLVPSPGLRHLVTGSQMWWLISHLRA